jgi:hypothetical protein
MMQAVELIQSHECIYTKWIVVLDMEFIYVSSGKVTRRGNHENKLLPINSIN